MSGLNNEVSFPRFHASEKAMMVELLGSIQTLSNRAVSSSLSSVARVLHHSTGGIFSAIFTLFYKPCFL